MQLKQKEKKKKIAAWIIRGMMRQLSGNYICNAKLIENVDKKNADQMVECYF